MPHDLITQNLLRQPHKQPLAHLQLQIANLPMDRWLGHIQPPRCHRKAELGGNLHEVTQMTQFQVGQHYAMMIRQHTAQPTFKS
jgi:hypothetical protein